jgi:hypothetical protein
MSVSFRPYIDSESSPDPRDSNGDSTDAYIPVRVPGRPRRDGHLLVYLPDGTGLVVNGRHLLRVETDRVGGYEDPPTRSCS